MKDMAFGPNQPTMPADIQRSGIMRVKLIRNWVIILVVMSFWLPGLQIVSNAGDIPILAQASPEDSAQPAGGPQIFLPETEYDFGTVAQDLKVSHKFIVRNVGDAPLKLISAKGS